MSIDHAVDVVEEGGVRERSRFSGRMLVVAGTSSALIGVLCALLLMGGLSGGFSGEAEADALLQSAKQARSQRTKVSKLLSKLADGEGSVELVPANSSNTSGFIHEVSCQDTVSNGRAGCYSKECDLDRRRFHLPVGTEVTVKCPSQCYKEHESYVYGPGDGSTGSELCLGYQAGSRALFSDDSSICRTAIAMRSLAGFGAGYVTFKIAEPIKVYSRCEGMPKAAPGLPYGAMLHPPPREAKATTTVGSRSWTVHDWAKASRPENIAKYGGPEKCCFDKLGKHLGAVHNDFCCAIMKYRQYYHNTPNGYGYWTGVRSLQIVNGMMMTGLAIDKKVKRAKVLTADSGHAAVPGGSFELQKDVKMGLTVEAWVRDNKALMVEPMSAYVSTLVDADDADPDALEYGFVLGVNEDGVPSFTLATKIGKKAVTIADKSTSRLDKSQDWMHLVGTYDGEKMRLYVNGVLKAEADKQGEVRFHQEAPLLLMRRTTLGHTAGLQTTVGEIDEIRIWRRPLTECAITHLMKVQPTSPLPKDLLVYYRMDGQASPDSREICSETGGFRAYMVGDMVWLDSTAPVVLSGTTSVCRIDSSTGLRDEKYVTSLMYGPNDFYNLEGDCPGDIKVIVSSGDLTPANIQHVSEVVNSTESEMQPGAEPLTPEPKAPEPKAPEPLTPEPKAPEPLAPAPLAGNLSANETVPIWAIENAFEDVMLNATENATLPTWWLEEEHLELNETADVSLIKPIIASCGDSLSDGAVHCIGDGCAKSRDRFHGKVGDVFKVWCPAHCSQVPGAVYGPGDGSFSEEECSGYKDGKKSIFLDASSICRSAIAMRSLGLETAGIVVFRIVRPVPAYPSCQNMPHKTPGMPYRMLNGHRGDNGINSDAVIWRAWKLAKDPGMLEIFGDDDKCCMDTQPCPMGLEYNSSSLTCSFKPGHNDPINGTVEDFIHGENDFLNVNLSSFTWNESLWGKVPEDEVLAIVHDLNVTKEEAEVMLIRGSPCSGIGKKKDCKKLDECRFEEACGCIPSGCSCSDFDCIYGPTGAEENQDRRRRLLQVLGSGSHTGSGSGSGANTSGHGLGSSAANASGHGSGSGSGSLHKDEQEQENGEQEPKVVNDASFEDWAQHHEPVMAAGICCAKQKFRQEYKGRSWMGVRAFEIDQVQSQGNDGLISINTNTELDQEERKEKVHLAAGHGHALGRTSGYAAVPHGSTLLQEDAPHAITVEAWVLDRGMRPETAYVSTAVDSYHRYGEELGEQLGEQLAEGAAGVRAGSEQDYGFSLGIHDGTYTFSLAGNNTGKFDRVSAPEWMTTAGRRRWVHIAGIYDGDRIHIVVDGSYTNSARAGGGPINYLDKEPLHLMRLTLNGKSNQLPTLRGEMDEVRIWRRALMQCHLAAVMHRTITAPLPLDLVLYFRMDGQAGPATRRLCSEGGRYTADLRGKIAWSQSQAPVWMLQTTSVCSVDYSTGLRSRFATADAPYGTHAYVNDTNFQCGGGGGGGHVEVRTEVVKEYVTRYIQSPPVEVIHYVDKPVEKIVYQPVDKIVYQPVDKIVYQPVDKIVYVKSPPEIVEKVVAPKVAPVPVPVPSPPTVAPPAVGQGVINDNWDWIHRVRKQLSRPSSWKGHSFVRGAFPWNNKAVHGKSIVDEIVQPERREHDETVKAVVPQPEQVIREDKPRHPSPPRLQSAQPNVPWVVQRTVPAEQQDHGGFYWVKDANGNIVGPARQGSPPQAAGVYIAHNPVQVHVPQRSVQIQTTSFKDEHGQGKETQLALESEHEDGKKARPQH